MAEQRYRVVDRLEAGGMAEVFRGEAVSLQGFKKQVAIKRVLPHLAQNRSFISMFLDEARLGARLNHANIVSVLDIGAADNTYFLVMEFVDGGNLKSILEGLKDMGQRIGVKEALYIAMEVCRGLSYAHEVADEEGNPLRIVHRDISPPNILMTKRGEVKVTDFGLAKATTQLEKTDPGVVKGKFSYLAPEAAMGEAVDERADIFAVGIVTWEALAGRRLFLGESDYETVKRVQKAEVPSLQELNSEVDDDLVVLLGKALTRDRSERFQSAREFGDAIADYLFSKQLKVTSYDLAALIGRVLDGKSKRKKLKVESSIIDQLIQEELLAFTSLDDMNDPLDPASGSSRPPAGAVETQLGALPLDAGMFGSGFSNAGTYSSRPPVGAAGQLGVRPSDPTDLAALLEDDKPPRPLLEDSVFDDEITGMNAVPDEVEAEALRQAAKSEPPRKTLSLDPGESIPPQVRQTGGGGSGKYVVIAIVVLLGAGAAAWFGNLIPH